jgi:hypothetical protein
MAVCGIIIVSEPTRLIVSRQSCRVPRREEKALKSAMSPAPVGANSMSDDIPGRKNGPSLRPLPNRLVTFFLGMLSMK